MDLFSCFFVFFMMISFYRASLKNTTKNNQKSPSKRPSNFAALFLLKINFKKLQIAAKMNKIMNENYAQIFLGNFLNLAEISEYFVKISGNLIKQSLFQSMSRLSSLKKILQILHLGNVHKFVTNHCKNIGICRVFCYKGRGESENPEIRVRYYVNVPLLG